MNKSSKYKLLLNLSAGVLITSPIAFAISCGSTRQSGISVSTSSDYSADGETLTLSTKKEGLQAGYLSKLKFDSFNMTDDSARSAEIAVMKDIINSSIRAIKAIDARTNTIKYKIDDDIHEDSTLEIKDFKVFVTSRILKYSTLTSSESTAFSKTINDAILIKTIINEVSKLKFSNDGIVGLDEIKRVGSPADALIYLIVEEKMNAMFKFVDPTDAITAQIEINKAVVGIVNNDIKIIEQSKDKEKGKLTKSDIKIENRSGNSFTILSLSKVNNFPAKYDAVVEVKRTANVPDSKAKKFRLKSWDPISDSEDAVKIAVNSDAYFNASPPNYGVTLPTTPSGTGEIIFSLIPDTTILNYKIASSSKWLEYPVETGLLSVIIGTYNFKLVVKNNYTHEVTGSNELNINIYDSTDPDIAFLRNQMIKFTDQVATGMSEIKASSLTNETDPEKLGIVIPENLHADSIPTFKFISANDTGGSLIVEVTLTHRTIPSRFVTKNIRITRFKQVAPKVIQDSDVYFSSTDIIVEDPATSSGVGTIQMPTVPNGYILEYKTAAAQTWSEYTVKLENLNIMEYYFRLQAIDDEKHVVTGFNLHKISIHDTSDAPSSARAELLFELSKIQSIITYRTSVLPSSITEDDASAIGVSFLPIHPDFEVTYTLKANDDVNGTKTLTVEIYHKTLSITRETKEIIISGYITEENLNIRESNSFISKITTSVMAPQVDPLVTVYQMIKRTGASSIESFIKGLQIYQDLTVVQQQLISMEFKQDTDTNTKLVVSLSVEGGDDYSVEIAGFAKPPNKILVDSTNFNVHNVVKTDTTGGLNNGEITFTNFQIPNFTKLFYTIGNGTPIEITSTADLVGLASGNYIIELKLIDEELYGWQNSFPISTLVLVIS